MVNNFTFQAPVRIIFGNGSLDTIGQESSALGVDKILLVTDENMAGTPTFATVMGYLNEAKIKPAVFSGAVEEPDAESVERGLAVLRENDCLALIALGGGSSIDTAKAIAILATNPPPIQQYAGAGKVSNPTLPLIAIPTTAGTGSEVSNSTLIRTEEEKRKYVISSPFNYARVAILDPAVLATLPKRVAVASGMDAVIHGVESYLSKLSSPMTEMYSHKSISLSLTNIRDFVADRGNLEAASSMLLASMLAATAMSNCRLTIVHALANPLGIRFHMSHGESCAAILPACLEAMADVAVEKFATIVRIMAPEMKQKGDTDCAQALPGLFAKLLSDLGMEARLSKFGVKESDAKEIAEVVARVGVIASSPKECSAADFEQILCRSL